MSKRNLWGLVVLFALVAVAVCIYKDGSSISAGPAVSTTTPPATISPSTPSTPKGYVKDPCLAATIGSLEKGLERIMRWGNFREQTYQIKICPDQVVTWKWNGCEVSQMVVSVGGKYYSVQKDSKGVVIKALHGARFWTWNDKPTAESKPVFRDIRYVLVKMDVKTRRIVESLESRSQRRDDLRLQELYK
jgi:hypothetical protein